MTNINSTWTGFPTDPVGTTLFLIFFIIGLIASGIGILVLLMYVEEKIKNHFNRLNQMKKSIQELEGKVWYMEKKLRESSVSPETKTGE